MSDSDHEFHSGSQPMASLQGGMSDPITQQPMESDNDMNRRPQNDSPVEKSWTSGLAAQPGMSPNNDKVIPR